METQPTYFQMQRKLFLVIKSWDEIAVLGEFIQTISCYFPERYTFGLNDLKKKVNEIIETEDKN